MLNKMRVLLVGLVVAGALAGCSFEASVGQKSINESDVERQIVRELSAVVGVEPAGMDCSGISEIPVESGESFRCVGVAPNGDEFPVDVTLTDDEGGFRADVPDNPGQS